MPVRLATGKPFGTLVEDSLKRRPLRLPADGTLSPDRTLLTVRFNTKAKNRLEIVLDSTAITAITGQPLRLQAAAPGHQRAGRVHQPFGHHHHQGKEL